MQTKVEKCAGHLCSDDPSDICYAPDPDNIYVCTRPKGHAGPHIACSGSTHHMKAWNGKFKPADKELVGADA